MTAVVVSVEYGQVHVDGYLAELGGRVNVEYGQVHVDVCLTELDGR